MKYRSSLTLFLTFNLIFLQSCSTNPDKIISAKDGAEMRLISGGTFSMGGRESELENYKYKNYANYSAERPLHQVTISTFYMDTYEVTNGQYKRFLQYIKSSADRSMDHPQQPADWSHDPGFSGEQLLVDEKPVVGMNWFDAYAYCGWAGKRMPTEAEWEYAARGGDSVYRTYPWGNEPPDADGIWRANYAPSGGKHRDGWNDTSPGGSFPDGVSPFGIQDMVGNVEEWVADWHDLNYYDKTDGVVDPQGPETGRLKVIKGGSYNTDIYHIRIATRLYGTPSAKSPLQGIRCAKNVN